ncbi:MAG TPA: PDZ domain-containing protein [Fimbriimonadaceae bacterium]|nr:PDZ domain-containing protein [Fimbriimonadaceae bacterium]
MNDVQRSFVTAGVICAASASLILGIHTRQRVDSGETGIQVASVLEPGLMASNTKEVDIPEERYFFDLTALLKREYVDPVENETKLASGAVKGMISSLNDERSLYMPEPLFQAFTHQLIGQYEGIGAELTLMRPPSGDKPLRTYIDFLQRIPRVVVTYVAPGGPADKAGVHAGDEIERIDGRWVMNPDVADKYRALQKKIEAKEVPPTALSQLENDMRAKFKNSMMPMRALERLSEGESGAVKLQVRRGAGIESFSFEKSRFVAPFNALGADGSFRLSFVPGASIALAKAIEESPNLTIDLRGVRHGDLDELTKCLAVLAPGGTYGKVSTEEGEVQTIQTSTGAKNPKPVQVRVDRYTAGVAAAFVEALMPLKLVTVTGGPVSADTSIIERTELPDGSGFTLRIGTFKAGGAH